MAQLSDASKQVLENELQMCKESSESLQQQIDRVEAELDTLKTRLKECRKKSEGIVRDLGRTPEVPAQSRRDQR